MLLKIKIEICFDLIVDLHIINSNLALIESGVPPARVFIWKRMSNFISKLHVDKTDLATHM